MYLAKTPKKALVLLMLFIMNSTLQAQSPIANDLVGKWLVNFEHPDIGMVRTVLEFEVENNTYKAFTRKDADKDFLGATKAVLSRGMSNFKNGSLMRVEKGEFVIEHDSIKLKGVLVSSFGNYNFIGQVFNKELKVNLSKRDLITMGSVAGSKTNLEKPLDNYPQLVEAAIQVAKDKIYNKQLFEQSDWQKFIENVQEVAPKIQDDLEMISAFYYFSDKLKTSHFGLIKESSPAAKQSKQQLFLEEKSATTAYLKIKSFNGTAIEVDSIFQIILAKKYSNLIVDLRENAGGTVEAGMAFANHVFKKQMDAGIFLTQKWFNSNKEIPSANQYSQFDHFSAANFDLIIEGIHQKNGLVLQVKPDQTVYEGNLLVLVDKGTASTCEPLVYALKQAKLATIIGEKTAGAMLNGEKFKLPNGFLLYVPTADYYSSDGYRIDQHGVVPDIAVKSAEALETALSKYVK